MELVQTPGEDMGSAGGEPTGNCDNLSNVLTGFSRVGVRLRRTVICPENRLLSPVPVPPQESHASHQTAGRLHEALLWAGHAAAVAVAAHAPALPGLGLAATKVSSPVSSWVLHPAGPGSGSSPWRDPAAPRNLFLPFISV